MLIAREGPGGEAPTMCFAGQWNAPSQGAELLAPALRDACERLRIGVADIRRIAVVRGPGSFTGIRLALATASGLARATGAELGGIDYLPLLAQNARAGIGLALPRPLRLFALTHARRNLVHMQGFACDENGPLRPLQTLTGILALSPDEAARRISALAPPPLGSRRAAPLRESPPSDPAAPLTGGNDLLLFGSGLSRNRETLASALADSGLATALLLAEGFDHPTPETLLAAAHEASYGTADIVPLYVRPSDAEDNLDHIAGRLGLDPARARLRLASLTRSGV